jgi:hypothetical protein
MIYSEMIFVGLSEVLKDYAEETQRNVNLMLWLASLSTWGSVPFSGQRSEESTSEKTTLEQPASF